MNQQQEQAEKQIEISIENAKAAIEKRDTLMSLFEDKRFKLIFEEGYFTEEPARLVSLLADSEYAGDEVKQQAIRNDMMGISVLRQYFLGINQMGVQMMNAVAASEEALEDLRNEEG